MSAAIAIRRSRLARPRVSRAARIQIGIFLLAYRCYSAARYVTVGDLDQDGRDEIVYGASDGFLDGGDQFLVAKRPQPVA